MHDLETLKRLNDEKVAKYAREQAALQAGPVGVPGPAPMREAKLIVPLRDNQGRWTGEYLDTVRNNLLTSFGGFTEAISVTGWWVNDAGKRYTEPVRVFHIAAEDNVANHNELWKLAQQIKLNLRQEAVYLRSFDGVVRLV